MGGVVPPINTGILSKVHLLCFFTHISFLYVFGKGIFHFWTSSLLLGRTLSVSMRQISFPVLLSFSSPSKTGTAGEKPLPLSVMWVSFLPSTLQLLKEIDTVEEGLVNFTKVLAFHCPPPPRSLWGKGTGQKKFQSLSQMLRNRITHPICSSLSSSPLLF